MDMPVSRLRPADPPDIGRTQLPVRLKLIELAA
jgi:hypothetical protein